MTTGGSPEFEEFIFEEVREEPLKPPRVPPTRPTHPSIIDLITVAITEGRSLVMAQIELIKIKAKTSGKKLAAGLGAFLLAILLALYLVWWTFHTAEVGLSYAVPAWAASLITWGIILVLLVVCVVVGVLLVKRAAEEAPRFKEGIEDDIEALREGKDER